MKAQDAGELGNRAAHFYENHESYNEGQANAVNTAVTHQAYEYFPDDAVKTVIEHGDGLPLVLAATDSHLYAIAVDEAPEDAPAATECRILKLDPSNCSVKVQSRYRGRRSRGLSQGMTWSIRVADLAIVISARVSGDGTSDDRVAFARHLAGRLGWSFPAPVGLEAAA